MDRRGFIKRLGMVTGGVAASGLMNSSGLTAAQPNGSAAGNPQARPNILYIIMDEWGYYELSCLGHTLHRTPNIDRLAREGMRFTQCLAGGAVCAPTRSVLMTGQHLGHTSVRSNAGGGAAGALRAEDVTVATLLKQAGYATGGFGKWGLGDRGTSGVPENHGFDQFYGYYHQVHAHCYFPRYLVRNSALEPLPGNTGAMYQGETYSHQRIFEEAKQFITANKERPFFCYCPWTPPHGLWGMPDSEPAWPEYRDKPWTAGQQTKNDAKVYAAMIAMVDRQVGELLDLLVQLKIDRNTLVVFSGDNGAQRYFDNFFSPNRDPVTGREFRGQKGQFYEGGLRVPYLVRWPGRIEPGSVSDHLCYFADVMPTLAELAGAQISGSIDGISFAPTLMGETGERKQHRHDYLYWESPDGWRAVRMQDWKAVKPGKAKAWQLFNLAEDIEESRDLAEANRTILDQMIAHAQAAHSPQQIGTVIDPLLAFDGKW